MKQEVRAERLRNEKIENSADDEGLPDCFACGAPADAGLGSVGDTESGIYACVQCLHLVDTMTGAPWVTPAYILGAFGFRRPEWLSARRGCTALNAVLLANHLLVLAEVINAKERRDDDPLMQRALSDVDKLYSYASGYDVVKFARMEILHEVDRMARLAIEATEISADQVLDARWIAQMVRGMTNTVPWVSVTEAQIKRAMEAFLGRSKTSKWKVIHEVFGSPADVTPESIERQFREYRKDADAEVKEKLVYHHRTRWMGSRPGLEDANEGEGDVGPHLTRRFGMWRHL